MRETNQEGYQTLGWIINESQSGLYLVVADEKKQSEILDIYRQGAIGIYDCRLYSGAYSFQKLKEKIESWSDKQTIFVANFQLAIRNEEDLRKLNFSRDMLAGMKKNLVFLTTTYGDDLLSRGAYDFYSFIKVRVQFHDLNKEKNEGDTTFKYEGNSYKGLQPEENREKIEESYILVQQAKEMCKNAEYGECEKLLIIAKEIREQLLGEEHLETVDVYLEIAQLYSEQGEYRKAEELYRKSLKIKENILGEEHPDVVILYNELGILYGAQGKLYEAEQLVLKALRLARLVWGEEQPEMASCYQNLAAIYTEQGRYFDAVEMYKRALDIYKRVLGTENLYTVSAYAGLARVYKKLEKYKEAEELYIKVLQIREKMLGENHPDIALQAFNAL